MEIHNNKRVPRNKVLVHKYSKKRRVLIDYGKYCTVRVRVLVPNASVGYCTIQYNNLQHSLVEQRTSWFIFLTADVLFTRYCTLFLCTNNNNTAEEYIVSRKGTIAEYAENSDIYQKCLQTEGLNNNNRKIMWWTPNIVKSNEAEISYMESDPVL